MLANTVGFCVVLALAFSIRQQVTFSLINVNVEGSDTLQADIVNHIPQFGREFEKAEGGRIGGPRISAENWNEMMRLRVLVEVFVSV